MDSDFSKIQKILESNEISSEDRKEILMAFNAMNEKLGYKDFKLKRTLKDKGIITNILNETIARLEERSEMLSIQAEKLEEQSKFKEELFANVSHELRTPLHGILGMGHLLEKTILDNNQQGYVGIIKGSADNLLVIINDILSLSEINAGKIKINKEPFSLYQLLEDLEHMLKIRTQDKGIQLVFDIAQNVPEFIVSDRTRIYQIIINLLNNSIKFTHIGKVELLVKLISTAQNKVELQFQIKDTGIGMKKEKLTSIFESFTRVHEERGVVYEGAGLGLNIVKNLLDLLQGDVEVESELNKGTCFTLKMPFELPEEEIISELLDSQRETVIPTSWKGLKFLMIEDNSANILYSKDMFAQWNLSLDIAPNLKDAKELLTNKYDVILSDVKLPDGDGLEFIGQLRNDNLSVNQNTPVIVLTASANIKGAERAKELDVQSYLSKPFPPNELINELHNVFNLKSKITMNPEEKNFSTEVDCQEATISTEMYLEKISKRFKGRRVLMAEMSKIFLDQAPEMIKILEECPAKEDYEAIRFEAHKFKSTVNIVGLENLRIQALKLEEIFHKGKPGINTDEMIAQFIVAIKHSVCMVEEVIPKILEASGVRIK